MGDPAVIHLTAKLGGGTQGSAWRTESGDVVKFTTSREEVVICDRLRALQNFGIEFRHFPRIASISKAGGMFAILREDAPDIDETDDLSSAMWQFSCGWTHDTPKLVKAGVAKVPGLRSVHGDLQNFEDLTGIRILDLGSVRNFGGALDRLILRDIGMGENVEISLFDKVAWDDVAFVDPVEFRLEAVAEGVCDDPAP